MFFSKITLLAILISTAIFAADVKFSEDSKEEIEIELTLNSSETTPKPYKASGFSFSRIPIENEGLLFKQSGLPELPKIHRWIVIDSAADFQIEVTEGKHQTYRNILIYPAQPDRFETQRTRFQMNKLAYLKNFWFGGERVSIGNKIKLGGLTLLPITFSPSAYNPQKRELKIFESIKLTIKLIKGVGSDSNLEVSQFVATQARELTLNGNHYISQFRKVRTAKRLLLLHSPILRQQALELTKIHQAQGHEAVSIEIAPGTNGDNVKKLITTYYQSHPLDAVLIFGDESMIPMRSSGGQTGDFLYSLLSGTDPISDVAVGRIPAKTEIQGNLMVNKIRTLLTQQSKGIANKKVMLIAHREEYPGKYTRNMEKIRTSANPRNLEFNTQYGGEQGQSTTVVEEAQRGYAILNYRGHGSTTTWSSWGRDGVSFSTTHVKQLPDNETGLSFIFNVACYNGSLQSSSVSLVERQLFPSDNEQTLQGAVGTLGATAPSMTETNHRFNLNLFEFLQNADDISIGNIYTLANNKLTKDNGGSATSNTRMYLLFSDPLLSPSIE